MKFIQCSDALGKERLFASDKQVVVHLNIPKGHEVPSHMSKMHVVIVPIKGETLFGSEEDKQVIKPGMVVVMEPGEMHSVKALEDSEVIVIHTQFD